MNYNDRQLLRAAQIAYYNINERQMSGETGDIAE